MDPGCSMKCLKEYLQELPIFDRNSVFFSRLRLCFKKIEAERYLKIDTLESRTDMKKGLVLDLWTYSRIFQKARGGPEAKENTLFRTI